MPSELRACRKGRVPQPQIGDSQVYAIGERSLLKPYHGGEDAEKQVSQFDPLGARCSRLHAVVPHPSDDHHEGLSPTVLRPRIAPFSGGWRDHWLVLTRIGSEFSPVQWAVVAVFVCGPAITRHGSCLKTAIRPENPSLTVRRLGAARCTGGIGWQNLDVRFAFGWRSRSCLLRGWSATALVARNLRRVSRGRSQTALAGSASRYCVL